MTRTRIAVTTLLAVLLVWAGLSVQSLLAIASGPETPSSFTKGQLMKSQPLSALRARTAIDYGSGLWVPPTGAVKRVGDPATADVLMVGDSITNGCSTDLIAAFATKGLTLAVIAQSGQNAAGLYLLLSALDNTPQKVVFAGGTNDVFNPFGVRSTVANVKQWGADTGVTVHLVDTYVARPATMTHDQRNSGQVNGYLYGSGLHVISPVEALTAAVGRGRPTNYYISSDGVHYWADAGTGHGDGCAFYAATIAAGVN